MGRLDVVVNAHDLPFAKPLGEISPAEWRRVLDVNLTGVYLACRAAGQRLPVSSGSTRRGLSPGRHISASKSPAT